MSSYFDEASLVMIPSGYKNQKVYSVKPLDGSGDLTFSRASSATRVASNGLIEKVRTNLFTYSQLFSNAAWTKTGLTLTGSQTDPNGGTTAFLATATATSSSYFYQSTTTAGCVSIYAKAGTRSKFSIINGLFAQGAEFNLATQTTIVSGAGSLAKIESVGGGWFRCSVFLSSITDAIIALDEVYGGGVTVGQTMSFSFAQHETGNVATAYIATTSAAVSVGPVSGLPRLDYLNSTCPRLLLEPQRTNLQTNSENGTGTNWGNSLRVNVTANQVASPDGYVNADSIADTAANGTHWFETSFSATSGTAYTLSFFAKANTLSQVTIYGFSDNGVFALQQAIFNVSNGTVVSNTGGGTTNVVNYGNGWYRVSLTLTAGATATGYLGFGLAKNGSSSYTGNGSSLYMWGIQLEASAYMTSYIPTLGTSVTRVADAASKTGISSLIGQTEGTLFVDLTEVNDLDFPEITIDNNNNTDRIVLTRSAAGNWGIFVASSAASTYSVYSTTSSSSGKFALAYSSAGYTLYRNGVQIVTGTYNLPTALSAVRLNGRSSSDFYATKKVGQLVIFPTRLSNSDLAALTA